MINIDRDFIPISGNILDARISHHWIQLVVTSEGPPDVVEHPIERCRLYLKSILFEEIHYRPLEERFRISDLAAGIILPLVIRVDE